MPSQPFVSHFIVQWQIVTIEFTSNGRDGPATVFMMASPAEL